MDITATQLVKSDDVRDSSPLLFDAVEPYSIIKGETDKSFIKTSRRNAPYVAKVLGNKPIASCATTELPSFLTGVLRKT